MVRLLPFVLRRLAFLIPQLLVATILSFSLVKLLPGDPAVLVLGIGAGTPGAVERMRDRLGLDDPLPVQYGKYLNNVVQGDWGASWFTKQPVLEDLAIRLPSTLELIILSLVICVIVGIVVGMITAMRPTGLLNRFLTWYGYLAGAIPDFWMGLLLIFLLFYLWGIAPAPVGQLSINVDPPAERTHVLLLDCILAGDWQAFRSALEHLMLPVLTLVLIYTQPVLKMTNATVMRVKNEPFIVAAKAFGLRTRTRYWYMLRNALPPIITNIGNMFVFLLGGAVLVETVFAWNGVGQFAVESVLRKDFFPIQGFILLAAAFTMFVYLAVDILYALVDPRVRL